ncbi:unnamed protein product [Hymenolepis diminuta]|uniref:Uncharacterized protein n=1 Tax=Hymenolepis diminuta TaxID=6216 RepID=A0A564XU48_HYMDI|nr:unnamed protein product [Hymenolepis diminuta]
MVSSTATPAEAANEDLKLLPSVKDGVKTTKLTHTMNLPCIKSFQLGLSLSLPCLRNDVYSITR